jgi:hypothetical protein
MKRVKKFFGSVSKVYRAAASIITGAGYAVCAGLALAVVLNLTGLIPSAGQAQEPQKTTPQVIALQVEWRIDGTFVNGRKVSDQWVAVVPPQQPQQVADSVTPLPAEKSEPTKKESVKNEVTEDTQGKRQLDMEPRSAQEIAVGKSVAAETAVEEIAVQEAGSAADVGSIPSENKEAGSAGIVPLPPAVVDINPLPLVSVEKVPQKEIIRRGLFGRRVITRRGADSVYTACKQRKGAQDCASAADSEKTIKPDPGRFAGRSRVRFGDGRILRALFRPFGRQ